MVQELKYWVKTNVFKFSEANYLNTQINTCLSRAAVASNNRTIDPKYPPSWEFSGFSQNGEDGVIDFLISKMSNVNKYFIEIGSGNGIENNTAYLAQVKKFSGLMIEGNPNRFQELLKTKQWLVTASNIFVQQENLEKLWSLILYSDPDVLSLDIDGNDYYILKMLLENGLKPKILVLEYNSAFGPEKSMTIKYDSLFDMGKTKFPYLYYGVSIKGWSNLLAPLGYRFVTVETNGVNAFFVHSAFFDEAFLGSIKGLEFQENSHQYRLFKTTWEKQFDRIKGEEFFNI